MSDGPAVEPRAADPQAPGSRTIEPRTTRPRTAELLVSRPERRRRPRRPPGPVALALGLTVVLLGDAAAVRSLRGLGAPPVTQLEVLVEGFSAGGEPPEATYGLTIANRGGPLTVLDVRVTVPGARTVGTSLGGPSLRRTGSGAFPVVLPPGAVTELGLGFRVEDCAAVPAGEPVPVVLRVRDAQGRTGRVPVVPPGLPSDRVGAAPDEDDPWQQVLVAAACPAP